MVYNIYIYSSFFIPQRSYDYKQISFASVASCILVVLSGISLENISSGGGKLRFSNIEEEEC